MYDIEPYTLVEKVISLMGAFIGSAIAIAIVFLVLLGLNKIILKKKINYFVLTIIAVFLITIIDILEGYLSGGLFFRRLLAGICVGFLWEKATVSSRRKAKER